MISECCKLKAIVLRIYFKWFAVRENCFLCDYNIFFYMCMYTCDILQFKRKSMKVIENLKYKSQILDAKNEELQLEKKALQ